MIEPISEQAWLAQKRAEVTALYLSSGACGRELHAAIISAGKALAASAANLRAPNYAALGLGSAAECEGIN